MNSLAAGRIAMVFGQSPLAILCRKDDMKHELRVGIWHDGHQAYRVAATRLNGTVASYPGVSLRSTTRLFTGRRYAAANNAMYTTATWRCTPLQK